MLTDLLKDLAARELSSAGEPANTLLRLLRESIEARRVEPAAFDSLRSTVGGAERLLERARPGVLFNDLAACNAYRDGLSSAAKVTAPATLVLGERDLMTPLKAGRELAAALPNARVVVLKGAGHMLMSERPDEVLAALRDLPETAG